jgi:hypothetical protein
MILIIQEKLARKCSVEFCRFFNKSEIYTVYLAYSNYQNNVNHIILLIFFSDSRPVMKFSYKGVEVGKPT